MKRVFIAGLMLVPLLSTAALAQTTEDWVDDNSDEEAQDWFEFSQRHSQSSGDSSDEDQTAVMTRSQEGPEFVEESESNDASGDISGVSVLPIVGNDILNQPDILSNLLNDYSQHDSSTNRIEQSRSEDNDHTSIIDDSFNAAARGKAPVVVLPARAVRAVDGGGVGKLPTTGVNFHWPLALAIWLITAGSWLIRTGGGRIFSLRLSH